MRALLVFVSAAVALAGCRRAPDAPPPDSSVATIPNGEVVRVACSEFDRSVEAFRASLVAGSDAPPKADPAVSPEKARAMVDAAVLCLKARGVRYTREGDLALVIESGEGSEPAAAARDVASATTGVAVFDGDFFLRRPAAAAAFDEDANRLSLPASAIDGKRDRVLVHELFHVASMRLLGDGPRARHVVLENASTKPDALSVDEVFAYAAGALSKELAPEDRAWSRKMANDYAAQVGKALADASTTYRLERSKDKPCVADAEPKAQIDAAIRCVKQHLDGDDDDLASCDAKPFVLRCGAHWI